MAVGAKSQFHAPPMRRLSTLLAIGEKQDSECAGQRNRAHNAAANLQQQAHALLAMESSQTSDVTVVVRVRPVHDSKHPRAVLTSGNTVGLRSIPGVRQDRVGRTNTDDHDDHDELFHRTLHPPRQFTFDAVMSETCSTERVFEWTGAKAVDEAVRGVTAVVFAYGQTGSGKTYTLLGEPGEATPGKAVTNHKILGVASMTVELLLEKLAERAAKENGAETDIVAYSVEVSAVQVYLNQVYDLLSANNKVLHLRSHTREKTHAHLGGETCELFPKETYEKCNSTEAFDAVLQRVVSQRVQGNTLMNTKSSRSHLILTLAVKRTVQIKASNVCSLKREHMSKLVLVDLAGNERDSARLGTKQEAILRAEGIDVNVSLCALSACLRERARRSGMRKKPQNKGEVVADAHKPTAHSTLSSPSTPKTLTSLQKFANSFSMSCCFPVVPSEDFTEEPTSEAQPEDKTSSNRGNSNAKEARVGLYRHSTLTRLLKEPLSRAKIFFLACCSPSAPLAAMTGQTLTYAAMVKRIKTSAEDSAILLEHSMDRFPIEYLPHHALVKHGQIPRSSERLTIYLHELRVSVVRVMISHRWFMPSRDPSLAHPDDKHHHKHELLCTLFQRLGAEGWIKNYDVLDVVTWLDFGECMMLICSAA
jgi:hypothetical protein